MKRGERITLALVLFAISVLITVCGTVLVEELSVDSTTDPDRVTLLDWWFGPVGGWLVTTALTGAVAFARLRRPWLALALGLVAGGLFWLYIVVWFLFAFFVVDGDSFA